MTTIYIVDDYTVLHGQTLEFTNESAFVFDGDASLYNHGKIIVNGHGEGVTGIDSSGNSIYSNSVFWNEANGVFHVSGKGMYADARGFVSGSWAPSVHNSGLFIVESEKGDATGVSDASPGTSFINDGTFEIHAGDVALGVFHYNGGTYTNTASMDVFGANGAYAIEMGYYASSLTNSGTIVAHDSSDSATSYGVDLVEGYSIGTDTIDNSGTIQAEVAIKSGGGAVALSNTGTIDGDIDLSSAYDTIADSGTINGNIYLGDGNDTFDGTGGTVNGVIYGGLGADTLTGTSAADTIYGDDASQTGQDGNDTLHGGDGDDVLVGGGGNDTLDGGDGSDTASYLTAPKGVTVDLSLTGAQATGGAGHDTLVSIENLIGSVYDDVLTGDTGNNIIEGGLGNNTLDGGDGVNTASYAHAASAVTVDLSVTGPQNTLGAGTDTLTNFENLLGSAFGDHLTGDANDNMLSGGEGDDVLVGGAGDDVLAGGSGSNILVGGSGHDTADYSDATGGVTVSLAVSGAQDTGGGGTDTLNGIENLTGSAFDDVLTGNGQANVFDLSGGGEDTVFGASGNDVFKFGGNFTGADYVDGGSGFDTLVLDGDYSSGARISAASVTGVEKVELGTGHSYTLSADDETVSAGGHFTIDGSALGAGDVMTYDGTSETDGRLILLGGAGNDVLTGGAQNDVIDGNGGADRIDLTNGGNDHADGGNGDDTFVLGATFTSADRIEGGAGNDTVELNGDYSGGVVLHSHTMLDVETILLDAGNSYRLSSTNATVAAGQTLTVDGSAFGAGDSLQFNGEHEQDGSFDFIGGAGNDVLIGGAENDAFDLSHGGNDTATGGSGDDTFMLGSTLTSADRIDGGGGHNTVTLEGDYSAGLSFNAATMTNVEAVQLASGYSYRLATSDATVATGKALTINGAGLGADDSLIFNGSHETDGQFTLAGGAGDDVLTGGAQSDAIYGNDGNDTLNLTYGGNDTASGGNGDDAFVLGAALTSADRIDGGDGNDTVELAGDYSAGLSFHSDTMTNVETLVLAGGDSYKLITADANVASGASLTVDGSALGAADSLTFDGAHETDGSFVLLGGSGQDTLTGSAGNDVVAGNGGDDLFDLTYGGNDTANGGAGNDTFLLAGALTAADQIDGGSGSNAVVLDGDYSAGLTFSATTMVDVQTLTLDNGFNYVLTTDDATVSAGAKLSVDASALHKSDSLFFDGTHETDGHFTLLGGAGADVLKGGLGNDLFIGGEGADVLTGGGGHNHFIYGDAIDSTGPNFDTIADFDAGADKFDLPASVNDIDTEVSGGALSQSSFNQDLKAAVDAAHLAAGNAVLFAPDSGDLAGHLFLIVDANGTAGYQANADFVFDITGAVNLDRLTVHDFI